MTVGELEQAKRRALNILDRWLDVTGAIDMNTSRYYELQSIVEDAVHCGAQGATGGSDASDFRMRQSDPPGLVALMVEWKRLRKAVNDADNGREGPPWSLIEECKAAYERVLAYPLPASPQAKED